jgi:hypothetical protein
MKCRINPYSLIVNVEKKILGILAGMEFIYGSILGDTSMLNRILFRILC